MAEFFHPPEINKKSSDITTTTNVSHQNDNDDIIPDTTSIQGLSFIDPDEEAIFAALRRDHEAAQRQKLNVEPPPTEIISFDKTGLEPANLENETHWSQTTQYRKYGLCGLVLATIIIIIVIAVIVSSSNSTDPGDSYYPSFPIYAPPVRSPTTSSIGNPAPVPVPVFR